jgi:Zn-dependent protease with chaperone function
MDFFTQQEMARRNTVLLIWLFVLALLLKILLINFLVELVIWGIDGSILEFSISKMDWRRFVLIGLAVSVAVLMASYYKWLDLAAGGRRIAESLGGVPIQPNTDSVSEKRVLNIAEEMAIASGLPIPPVYLLKNELGINAFAAGNTPADAVIGVTAGGIKKLNRDQLQGVIAHEFSHILNGDMRLNMRLIAALHGFVYFGSVGSFFSHGGGNVWLALFGFTLMTVGGIGTLIGNLIRSLVSRQREFLADASAVQFTRNPAGIADALKIIGGHIYGARLQSLNASEISHLFFGQIQKSPTNLFTTHPPLQERIARIEPSWDGRYIYPTKRELLEKQRRANQRLEELENKRKQKKQRRMDEVALMLSQGDVTAVHEWLSFIPAYLQQQAREPLGSMALVIGLLLKPEEKIRQKQLDYLKQQEPQGLLPLLSSLKRELDHMPRALHLPLVELTLPALRIMSREQYRWFRDKLLLISRVDEKIDLYEWCLCQVLQHFLDPVFGMDEASKPIYRRAQQVSDEYRLVLSLLAHHGHQGEEETTKAFNRGATSAGLYNLTLLPESECDIEAFKKAVDKLACCYPMLKPRLIMGLVYCVRQDGKLLSLELEILKGIAAAMDSQLPKLKMYSSEKYAKQG